jgi:tetraacyldisaccharide 4'-kinase
LVALRGLAYRRGWLASHRQAARVVVIGNLTVGGTGKTPLTIWLATQLRDLGLPTGIVLRGYGGAARGALLVDGHSVAAAVGDEALLIRQRTGCDVAVASDRVAAVRLLEQRGARVVIADDGLQHLRLQRDFELAVVDGARGFGNGHLLPAGPLREPLARLSRVNAVVINGHSRIDMTGAWQMRLSPGMLQPLAGNGSPRSLALLRGQPVHAVAGIGNPRRFFALLRDAGFEVHEHPFPDHHPFSAAELMFADGLPVLMTEKDAVRCRGFDLPNHWYLPVSAEFEGAAGRQLLGRVLMDARLLEIMVCPVCKGPLNFLRADDLLVCRADRLAYPIRDGVPVMLEEEARVLTADDPLLQR